MCALVQPVKSSKHDSNGTCQTKIARFTNIKNKNPKIELIIVAPSSDKKSLKKVEYAHIEEYS